MTDFIDPVNMSNELKLQCAVTAKTKSQIFQAIWGWHNGVWQPLQPEEKINFYV